MKQRRRVRKGREPRRLSPLCSVLNRNCEMNGRPVFKERRDITVSSLYQFSFIENGHFRDNCLGGRQYKSQIPERFQ